MFYSEENALACAITNIVTHVEHRETNYNT